MPDSQVVVVMNRHKAALLANEQAQMYAMAQRWLDVERALESQIAALAEEFARRRAAGETISQAALFRMTRYQSLLAQLQIELRNYTDYLAPLIEGQQRHYAELAISHAAQAIDASITTEVGARFDRLPIEAVENMVGLAGDGSPLRSLLVDTWPDAAQAMTQELIRSTALGVNPRETARRMANGTTRTLNRMLTIARTEQLRVYRQMSIDSYKASGVVKGFMRLATRSPRTCLACLVRDGEFFELEEEFTEHVTGRCTPVPVLFDVPPPQWEKGADWFRRQSPETQQSIMGKGRFAAWKDGKFDLDEAAQTVRNDVWGGSIQVKPLGELVGA